jgi:hypothetical protein
MASVNNESRGLNKLNYQNALQVNKKSSAAAADEEMTAVMLQTDNVTSSSYIKFVHLKFALISNALVKCQIRQIISSCFW